MSESKSGFAAMGQPILFIRRQAAYDALKEMGIDDHGKRMEVVGRTALLLERDRPFEAMEAACEYVDTTGAYRLFAHLLAGPEAPPASGARK